MGAKTVLAFAVVLSATFTGGAEPAPDLDRAIVGLQEWLDGTRELECRFEQTLLSGALGAGARETGRMWIEKPGRIRWEYTDPERKTALLLGRDTLLYLPEEHQLIRGTLDPEQSLLPDLLSRSTDLRGHFEISLLEDPGPAAPSTYRLRLVPRARREGFEEVVLTVESGGFAIVAAEVLDGIGNRTEFRFRRLRRNLGIPAGAFEFSAPPGTEVVEER